MIPIERADGNLKTEILRPAFNKSTVYNVHASERLPLIKIKCVNQEFFALVDSGASANLASKSILDEVETSCAENVEIKMNTLVGESFLTSGKVNVKFSIKNHQFEDVFNMVDEEMSPYFQLILGTPFLSKFKFSIDFLSNTLRNIDIVVPILRGPLDCVNNVSLEQNKLPAFAKRKILIPPLSEKIVEIKISRPDVLKTDSVLITPVKEPFSDSLFISHAICKNHVNKLFVKILNVGDEEIHINKNAKIATVQEIKSADKLHASQFVGHIDDEEMGNLHRSDLKWDTKFQLDHLDHDVKIRLEEFLKKNSDVFAASVFDLPGCSSVMHEIKLHDHEPVNCRPYRVPYNLRKEMDEQLNILLEANIIVPSNSNYASPVLLVKKADGGYRLAVDFRKLNKKLKKDTFPIPNINETIDSLSGARYFSTLDLMSGFHQQEIPKEHQHYTAITTHRGTFQFQRSPFGLSSSPNSFQRLMNLVLSDLSPLNILVYIDDICISSTDIDSHFEKLSLVFDRLRQHNLKLKPSKCHFLKTEITFLGFKIKEGKIFPASKNIEVVSKIKRPKSKKDVRSLLGCVGFYRKFFSDYSQRTFHLTNLLKGKGKFQWSDNAQAEFEDLKQSLMKIPSLYLPDMNKEFLLFTDASGVALGSVLAQLDEEKFPRPVAFASRKLTSAETRYSTTERELLALVWSVNYFKCYLFNKKFIVYSDHAALTHALKVKDPTSRIARWLSSLGDFDFETKYIKGKCNSVADFLSRFIDHENEIGGNINTVDSINVVSHVINKPLIDEEFEKDIKLAQTNDKFCKYITRKLCENLPVRPTHMQFFIENDIIKCKELRNRSRRDSKVKIVLPLCLISRIFSMTHESSAACHAGFFKTLQRIRTHYFWKGMYTHIKKLVASCQSCLEFRAHKRNGLAEIQRMPIPNLPFKVLHCDISGPYTQTFRGNKFIVSYVDSFSKWPEAFSVPEITSDTIAETLAEVICRHGCPEYLITDRGSNLISKAITTVYEKLGIKHIKTTAYHPQSNAKIER